MSTVTATTTGTTTSFGSQSIWSVNSGDLLRNVAIAFTVLETIAVALRFASLRLTKKQFGVDDFPLDLISHPLRFCPAAEQLQMSSIQSEAAGIMVTLAPKMSW